MGFTYLSRFDPKRIAEQITKSAEDAFNKQIQIEAGKIVTRTQAGQDKFGRAFKAYSDKYKEIRGRLGREVSPVDLTLTGSMLGAIQAKVERVANGLLGTIFFTNSFAFPPRIPGKTGRKRKATDKRRAVSAAAKAKFNMDAGRKFFGLSEDQIARIQAAVNKAIGLK